MEINEEERFNLEAAYNESNMLLSEVQAQNSKLHNEIALMTERNNQIEDTLQLLDNVQATGEEDIKTQLSALTSRIKELSDKNAVLE